MFQKCKAVSPSSPESGSHPGRPSTRGVQKGTSQCGEDEEGHPDRTPKLGRHANLKPGKPMNRTKEKGLRENFSKVPEKAKGRGGVEPMELQRVGRENN